MITITNMGPPGYDRDVKYQVAINGKVFCEFMHHRTEGGLARCLHDAATAVETLQDEIIENLISTWEAD